MITWQCLDSDYLFPNLNAMVHYFSSILLFFLLFFSILLFLIHLCLVCQLIQLDLILPQCYIFFICHFFSSFIFSLLSFLEIKYFYSSMFFLYWLLASHFGITFQWWSYKFQYTSLACIRLSHHCTPSWTTQELYNRWTPLSPFCFLWYYC